MRHIHFLGICGTFMGSLALLAKEKGFLVTGSDENIYPPMSTLLEKNNITIMEGYTPEHLQPEPDLIITGNAMTRGNPSIEHMLDKGLKYTSGPAFMAEYILYDKWVIAIAGTHGKTTVASMVAWILEYAGMKPGFLIGGIPLDFERSSQSGTSPFFVIEADEYDTAFFDKRSKFIHYRPRTLLLNNMEFDHADIFDDLKSIQTQFYQLIRTLPSEGLIIAPREDKAIKETLDRGCWTPVEWMGNNAEWSVQLLEPDGSTFNIIHENKIMGTIVWNHTGIHNTNNALGALLAARHVGVPVATGCKALSCFKGIKRRMELLAEVRDIRIYDDFAHHPTAIYTTLDGWRKHTGYDRKIFAVIEPRSNTMKLGVNKGLLANATSPADEVIWLSPKELLWSLEDVMSKASMPSKIYHSTDEIVNYLATAAKPGSDIIIMSNGGFDDLHKKLTEKLKMCTEVVHEE